MTSTTTTPALRLDSTLRGDGQPLLCCPYCDTPNGVHLDQVQVWARKEDAETRTILVDAVSGVAGTVPESISTPNPSDRRHAVALLGYCEICGQDIEISFAQHKGDTHVGFGDPK